MPDHLHMLVGIPGDASLSNLVRDFKRITAKIAGIQWQRNFFDHRLRHDENEAEKFEYICQNPVRAGLADVAHTGPMFLSAKRQPIFVERAIGVNRPYLVPGRADD